MFTLNCKGRLLLIDSAIVMGIVNCTPDSFYRESRMSDTQLAVRKAFQMIEEGATIIDIGGQSTRPGSTSVSVKVETERILPVIEIVKKTYPQIFISVDTFQSEVAEAALTSGADIINDISGGTFDERIIDVAIRHQAPFICMHIKGKPADMQKNPVYDDVCREILDYFIRRLDRFREMGLNDVILDPGLGFGKTFAHNFAILRKLEVFKIAVKPILIGISRKATVYRSLNISADEALNGTTVLNTLALQNGADILRVHDVKEAIEAVKLVELYKGAKADRKANVGR